MIHQQKSILAGKTVKIKKDASEIGGQEITIEDYWDRIYGKGWGTSDGNPAAMVYAMRAGFSKTPIPFDDEVVYGKINGLGYLVHVNEIES